MKKTGVYRRVDELGRIVIPKEIRNSQDINIKDPMEIYTDGNNIFLMPIHEYRARKWRNLWKKKK